MSGGSRKLIERSSNAPPDLLTANTNIDEAKNLLLMSALPPELTISHNPLGRTVSDSPASQATTRRKLESEDSSYDSDHENMTTSNVRQSLSNSMSKSHEDVSRTYSETLAQVQLSSTSSVKGRNIKFSGILRLRFYKTIARSFALQFELTIGSEVFTGGGLRSVWSQFP